MNVCLIQSEEEHRQVEVDENQPNTKAQTIYTELARARELATITRILAETQRPAAEQESFLVGTRGGLVCPD